MHCKGCLLYPPLIEYRFTMDHSAYIGVQRVQLTWMFAVGRASVTASRAADEVLERDAELVLHVGDLSYADGIHKIWDTFLEMVEPYASRCSFQIISPATTSYRTPHGTTKPLLASAVR